MRCAIALLVAACVASAARADEADAAVQAGRAFAAAGQFDKAVQSYTEALDRDPKNVAARDFRGDAYLKSGQFKEAIADFDAVLAAHPDRAAGHWRRGIALYYAGRYA